MPVELTGAVKLTVAWPLPAVAVTLVGAAGIATGVTLLDGTEAALLPVVLVATTVKVYAVPLVSPLTVRGLDVPVAVLPPEVDETV
jgi:hypothetical protein